jgi:hypothetical protein
VGGDPVSEPTTCKKCDDVIAQQAEKALSGEVQMVWANLRGEWVCEVDGDEHEPGEVHRGVEVHVTYAGSSTMLRLTLAEYGNFIVRPITEALDDGEAAWDLQDRNPERHRTLNLWARNLYKITSD